MAVVMSQPAQHGLPMFSLFHDEWGRLVLVDAQGGLHEGVTAIRAFPITDPERRVSICEATGRELLYIADLATLPAEIRQLLTVEFARREFLPLIRRIVHVSGRIEPCEWQVETDRGSHRFVLSAYEDVHRLGPNRAILFDAERIRYLIPDVRGLDAASRRYLERYL